MSLPGVDRVLTVEAEIVWREHERLGAKFKGLTKGDMETIDKALRAQFRQLRELSERYYQLAAGDPQAVACVALSRFYSAESSSVEAAAMELLNEAALKAPNAFELQLALAKTALDAGLLDRVKRALKSAELLNKSDPRVQQIRVAIGSAKAQGRSRLGVSDLMASMWGQGGRKRVAAAAFVVSAAIFAAIYVPMTMGGQLDDVTIPQSPRTLPCSRAQVGNGALVCVVNAAEFAALPAADREARAEATRELFAGKRVERVLVVSSERRFLQAFDGSMRQATVPQSNAPQTGTPAAAAAAAAAAKLPVGVPAFSAVLPPPNKR
jgi:hypothetical protein